MKPICRYLALAALVSLAPMTWAKGLTDQQVKAAAEKIDGFLQADLDAADLRANPLVDEGTFLRRAYLGIIGRIPTEDEAREFFENKSPEKRVELVDVLTVSPGFDSHLFNWAGDLLRLQTAQEQFGLGWHVWLRKSMAEDKPWDVLVDEMLSAEGHAAHDPAVGYYLRDRNMQLDNFSNTMQVFLGRQMSCAQCHDHPFDDWSQYEYYEMAAFGGGITYNSKDLRDVVQRVSADIAPKNEKARKGKKAQRARPDNKLRRSLSLVFKDFGKNALFDDPKRTLKLPGDYKYQDATPKTVVPAQTLFGKQIKDVAPEERRDVFAKWVTSPENPYFTKVIANRLWARVFGNGLVEPIDDWNDSSEAVHPEVMAYLEELMREADYDLRSFSRVLFRTQLFQRECMPDEAEVGVAPMAQGPALRRMTAEQLFDSMLVLQREDVSDQPTGIKEEQWEAYVNEVDEYLKKDSKELVRIGKEAMQAEELFQKLRIELREKQKAVRGAERGKTKQKAISAMKDMQERVSEANRLRYPIADVRAKLRGGDRKDDSRRASERVAPFRPGSLVREFGGSDRSIPSSGDTIPTVPQALALLNDYKTDVIRGKSSPLGRRLLAAETPAEKLEIAYIRVYSALPTDAEKDRYLPMASDREKFQMLIRAMMTSNRFIFIQ